MFQLTVFTTNKQVIVKRNMVVFELSTMSLFFSLVMKLVFLLDVVAVNQFLITQIKFAVTDRGMSPAFTT